MGSSERRRGHSATGDNGAQFRRRTCLRSRHLSTIASPAGAANAAAPVGQLVYGVHISLAPTWFDPAETPALITPFMLYYALHDALLKPMPDNPMAPSLANPGRRPRTD